MREVIQEKVSVISTYDRTKGSFLPVRIQWQGRVRTITKLGLHYTKREGRTLLHIFTVTDGALAYSLQFDTERLHWTLVEVADGNA